MPWRQPYSAGVGVKPPGDQVGTRVFPLDRLYYDIPRHSPGAVALRPPGVAFEKTFDILTMRSGWEKTAQYLILDGTGGGSHSYEDANAILTLTQDDRFLLLSADQLYFTAPKYHNMVTVTRNGLGEELPSYCTRPVFFASASGRGAGPILWFRICPDRPAARGRRSTAPRGRGSRATTRRWEGS